MEKLVCPLCKQILYKRNEGLVCKNWKCDLYFKCGIGWALLTKERENSREFHFFKCQAKIDFYTKRKEMLILKSKVLYMSNGKCENCGDDENVEVHHILHVSEYPEFYMEEENMMVLCRDCHIKIHDNDKHRWSKK